MARKVYLGIGGKSRAVKKMYVAPKPLNNLISDGMMEPGNWSGGTQDTAHVAFGSYSMRMNGQSGSPEALLTSTQSIALSSSHIYYAAVHAYQTTLQGSVDIYWPIAEPAFMVGKALPTANQWCRISGRNGRSSFSGSHPIRFDYNNSNAVGTMWFDGPMLIDLTAEFGAGKEPDQDWCDKNIVLGAGGDAFVKPNASIPAQSTARKIKKGYVGIGDVARPFWSQNTLEYWGTAEPLSEARAVMGSGSIGGYALFAGGRTNISDISTAFSTIDCYSTNMSKQSITSLRLARSEMASAKASSNYLLFSGGAKADTTTSNQTDAYNTSLTRRSATSLGTYIYRAQGASVGNYALIAGGAGGSGTTVMRSSVYTYSASLSRSSATSLSASKICHTGCNFYNNAVFAGGYTLTDFSDPTNTIDSYNVNLTKTVRPSLSSARGYLASGSVGRYLLVAGGSSNGAASGVSNIVDCYNTSFTRTLAPALSIKRYRLSCAYDENTVGIALFAGGYGSGSYTGTVDVYNINLTHSIAHSLSSRRYFISSATLVSDYPIFLFAGGTYNSSPRDVVDVYKYYGDYVPDSGGDSGSEGGGGDGGSDEMEPVG